MRLESLNEADLSAAFRTMDRDEDGLVSYGALPSPFRPPQRLLLVVHASPLHVANPLGLLPVGADEVASLVQERLDPAGGASVQTIAMALMTQFDKDREGRVTPPPLL